MANPKLSDWQREQAAKVAAAHPLTPAARIQAKSNHLLASNDEPEPTEAELQAADVLNAQRRHVGLDELAREDFALNRQIAAENGGGRW